MKFIINILLISRNVMLYWIILSLHNVAYNFPPNKQDVTTPSIPSNIVYFFRSHQGVRFITLANITCLRGVAGWKLRDDPRHHHQGALPRQTQVKRHRQGTLFILSIIIPLSNDIKSEKDEKYFLASYSHIY